jgi:hypothetical protein
MKYHEEKKIFFESIEKIIQANPEGIKLSSLQYHAAKTYGFGNSALKRVLDTLMGHGTIRAENGLIFPTEPEQIPIE